MPAEPGSFAPPPEPPPGPPPPPIPLGSPSPDVEPARPATATSGTSRQTVALGAAAIAGAAAIGAAVFGALALQNKSSYENDPTFGNTDDGNNFAAYADGCIALAAAAGVTSLVLFLTAPSTATTSGAPARAAVFSAAPVVLPHGGGAGAVLFF